MVYFSCTNRTNTLNTPYFLSVFIPKKGGTFLFQINSSSRTPIYEQLYNKIIELVMKGILKEDEQIPSVRALAKELGVNPNTVQKAYQELERNGIIYSLTGRGNFIAPLNPELVTNKALENFDKIALDTLKLGFSKEELMIRIKELAYD